MDIRKVVALIVVVLLTATVGYFALFGAAWGIYEMKPWAEQIPQGLDLTGGVAVVYEATDQDVDQAVLADNIYTVIEIMRRRLDSEGYTEATVTKQGNARVRIEIPINESNMVEDPSVVTQYLVRPANLTFVDPDGNVVFRGEDMEDVFVSNNPEKPAEYVVNFKLNETATAAFSEATNTYKGKPISIYLDEELISAPTVNTHIPDGQAYITSTEFSDYNVAKRLEGQIRSGALPIDMEEIEVRSVSATLGEEALSRGILAGAVALLIIFLFMAVYYRVPGIMADLALVIYLLMMMFCLATIPGVQLTLPGIAGIILSIGMAVDANVIIFERMREEIRRGKSLQTAVDLGFKRAFTAIMDSNVTTVIAALVLLFFGTGSIKGFAITLLIGIILSFITAVFITRGLMKLVLGFHIRNKAAFCPMKNINAQENN